MKTRILGVLSGITVSIVLIMLSHTLTEAFFPFPENVNQEDPAAMEIYIESMSGVAAALLLAAYAVGAFFGGLVAVAIAKDGRPAITVGFFLTIANIANVVIISHPLWFAITSTLLFLPFAWLGGKAAKRNTGTIY
jgi:hypothetical protein